MVHPAVSFLDLAFARLGVDPVAAGVRLVDAERFAVDAAGERGPLLVAQCWSRRCSPTSSCRWSAPEAPVTVLHHLGLADEQVREVAWEDLDRSFDPDHLTSLWVPALAAPVAAELVALDELVQTLRAAVPVGPEPDPRLARPPPARGVLRGARGHRRRGRRGRRGRPPAATGPDATAGSAAVADLEEELGDLLFQVYFHATLAAEEGRFTLADVARGVHDKLVSRHPHVFGDVAADDARRRWPPTGRPSRRPRRAGPA